MTASVHIRNASGSPNGAMVDAGGLLHVLSRPSPPRSEDAGSQPIRIFRQHLTTDGLATNGTNQSMLVNGSSTNVDFYVQASAEVDRYITTLSFAVVDASQTLNKFGNITALTTGCRLFYSDTAGEVDIHNAIKTNFQLIRLCSGQPAFGNAASAFLANNVAGTSEGYLPILDFRATFGFQWGLRLKKGSVQRVTMRIRDDVSALDQLDCIAYGFEME